MLSEAKFTEWCEGHNLSLSARRIIADIRSGDPARLVRSGPRNVPGRYASRKMGVTIQFESHTVEYAAAVAMDDDDDVLEYYDQPNTFTITYRAKSGRRQGHLHTPDFFVLHRAGACWEEWKDAGALPDLAEKSPNRYRRDADGTWRCPPGEEYAARFGLAYRVCSSAEIDWILHRNQVWLADYR